MATESRERDNPFCTLIEQVPLDGRPALCPRFCIERPDSYNPTDDTHYGLCGARWKYSGIQSGNYLNVHQQRWGDCICHRCLRRILPALQVIGKQNEGT